MSKLTDALRQGHVLIESLGDALYLIEKGTYSSSVRAKYVYLWNDRSVLDYSTSGISSFEYLVESSNFRIISPATPRHFKFVYDATIKLDEVPL